MRPLDPRVRDAANSHTMHCRKLGASSDIPPCACATSCQHEALNPPDMVAALALWKERGYPAVNLWPNELTNLLCALRDGLLAASVRSAIPPIPPSPALLRGTYIGIIDGIHIYVEAP